MERLDSVACGDPVKHISVCILNYCGVGLKLCPHSVFFSECGEFVSLCREVSREQLVVRESKRALESRILLVSRTVSRCDNVLRVELVSNSAYNSRFEFIILICVVCREVNIIYKVLDAVPSGDLCIYITVAVYYCCRCVYLISDLLCRSLFIVGIEIVRQIVSTYRVGGIVKPEVVESYIVARINYCAFLDIQLYPVQILICRNICAPEAVIYTSDKLIVDIEIHNRSGICAFLTYELNGYGYMVPPVRLYIAVAGSADKYLITIKRKEIGSPAGAAGICEMRTKH